MYFIQDNIPHNFTTWFVGYLDAGHWIWSDNGGVASSTFRSIYIGLHSHKALFLAPLEREILNLYNIDFSSPAVSFGSLTGWLIFGYLVLLMITGLRSMFKDKANLRFLNFLILWILPYLIFFQFFGVFQNFYRLYYLFPLLILMVNGQNSISYGKYRVVTFVIIFALIGYNVHYGFIPESKPEKNPYLQAANEINNKDLHESLLTFYPQDYFYAKYVRYFGSCDTSFLMSFNRDQFYWVDDSEFEENVRDTREWLSLHYENIYLMEHKNRALHDYKRIRPLFYKEEIPEIMLIEEANVIGKAMTEPFDYFIIDEKVFREVRLF